mgnify:FL=1
MQAAAGFDGACAYGSLVYVADDAEAQIDVARELLEDGDPKLFRAATCVGDVLIVRWVGSDSLALRTGYGEFWSGFRNRIAGYPAIMPRLWHM